MKQFFDYDGFVSGIVIGGWWFWGRGTRSVIGGRGRGIGWWSWGSRGPFWMEDFCFGGEWLGLVTG